MNLVKLFILLLLSIIIIFFILLKINIYKTTKLFNKLLEKNCNNEPIFDTSKIIWTYNFKKNWKEIKNEYLNYINKNKYIPLHSQINKYVSSCDLNNNWKTIYLRAFYRDTNIAKYFPFTMSLINNCDCSLAYFSILKPKTKLLEHIGIYKGVLRYHLGLIIPDDWKNCFIVVSNKKLYWKNGQDLMFDDMFPHYVENNTDQERVILFLDIKRKFDSKIINLLNTLYINFIKTNDELNKTINNINFIDNLK